jgi:lipopolysaccharide transport system permease protein
MVLLGAAAGLVLSVLGSIAKDLIPIATQVLALLMYVTPVIYLHSTIKNSLISTMIKWNPVTYLIDIPRSLICLGHTDHIRFYFLSFSGTLILVVIGLRIFYLLEDLVAERL